MLFSVIASGLGQVPTVTLAKAEHRHTWLGKLIAHCFDYPDVVDPKVIAFFDRAIVNDIIVNGPADLTRKFGILIRVHVTGHVYTYTLAMAIGSVGLGIFVWLRVV